MTNAANVKAIIANVESIISTTIGYNLEYAIRADEDVDTTPNAVLLYDGEEFEENFGEKPLYNEIKFEILTQFRESDPQDIRDKSVDIIHNYRGNITIDALNVGDISSSKVVSRVDHDTNARAEGIPVVQLSYQMLVRYREI
jgi:hypothetical protein